MLPDYVVSLRIARLTIYNQSVGFSDRLEVGRQAYCLVRESNRSFFDCRFYVVGYPTKFDFVLFVIHNNVTGAIILVAGFVQLIHVDHDLFIADLEPVVTVGGCNKVLSRNKHTWHMRVALKADRCYPIKQQLTVQHRKSFLENLFVWFASLGDQARTW